MNDLLLENIHKTFPIRHGRDKQVALDRPLLAGASRRALEHHGPQWRGQVHHHSDHQRIAHARFRRRAPGDECVLAHRLWQGILGILH